MPSTSRACPITAPAASPKTVPAKMSKRRWPVAIHRAPSCFWPTNLSPFTKLRDWTSTCSFRVTPTAAKSGRGGHSSVCNSRSSEATTAWATVSSTSAAAPAFGARPCASVPPPRSLKSSCVRERSRRESKIKPVAEAVLLGLEVALVVLVGGRLQRQALDDANAELAEFFNFLGIVGEQTETLHSDLFQHLGGDDVVPRIGQEPE